MTQADEFHHAAAPSYQELLDYYRPRILLGLTATPERADGRSIYAYFEGRIAAEIRLWEAIERKLLSPFHYFGVTDNVDLSRVRWVAGKYDEREIENLYVFERSIVSKRCYPGLGKQSSMKSSMVLPMYREVALSN